MTNHPDRIEVPQIVKTKLRGVRRRRTVLRGVEAIIIPLTAFLTVILLMTAVDWVLEVRAGWRLITSAAGLLAVAASAGWALLKLWRVGRTLSSTAADVDRAVPSLGERWSTIAELSESRDPLVMKGAPSLIRKVSDEAVALAHLVAEESIVLRRPTYRWAGACAAAAVVVLLAFAISPANMSFLCHRFFAPLSDLPFTRVTSLTGDREVPKSEPLAVEASVEGKVRGWATLQIRGVDQKVKDVGLVRDETNQSKYTYTLRSVDEPLEYRVESGDGRTAWHKITPIERPSFGQVRFKVTPPEYTRLAVDQKDALPREYRAVEGSRLELEFLATKPLKEMKLQTGKDRTIELTRGEGDWYHYVTSLKESVTLSASMTDRHGLSSSSPATSSITVYADQPPTVSISAPGDNVALPPDDMVKVDFKATDDFGLSKAELVVEISPPPLAASAQKDPANAGAEPTTNPAKPITRIIPIPLDPTDSQKTLRREVDLDLKPLDLKTGQQVSYFVRVTDTRMAEATSGSQSSQNPASQSSEALAKASSQPLNPSSNQDNHIAQSSHPPKSSKNQGEDSPDRSELPPKPPENVTMRWAPFPNSASSSKRSIKVDEWAGTAGNDVRAKLEIAIDKFLADLDAALAAAQKPTDALKLHAAQKLNWTPAEDAQLATARKSAAEAGRIVSEAVTKTAGTPYAFMGLQLGDIGVSHVDPARKHLATASTLMDKASEQHGQLDRASYHIAQARLRLANLTREYEAVKKDNQLADAMQHLQKMHQLYLKDLMMVLASSKPKLNPMNRKIQEISDEMVKKLAERAEAAAELRKKLAEATAKDPELLKRIMARMRVEAINLRDVYTLQERQQQEQLRHVAQRIDTPADLRQTLNDQLRGKEMAAAVEIAENAAKLDDDIKTWAPRKVDATRGSLAKSQELSTEIALAAVDSERHLREGRALESSDAARLAADKINRLNDELAGVLLEHPANADVRRYVEFRKIDAAKLAIRLGLYIERSKALRGGDFARYARIEQTRLMTETLELQTKLLPVGRMYAGVPAIREKAKQLDNEITRDVIDNQQAASVALADQKLQAGRDGEGRAVQGYATSSKTFDELRRLIVDYEDAKGPPKSLGGGGLPTLEELIAQLEKEKRALEGLCDCMPVNVAVSTDWTMSGQEGMGSGMNGDLGMAAAQASQRASIASNRLGPPRPGGTGEATEKLSNSKQKRIWDVHASQLQKDLRQMRGNSLPAEYREAIEDYMRILAEQTSNLAPTPAAPTVK